MYFKAYNELLNLQKYTFMLFLNDNFYTTW